MEEAKRHLPAAEIERWLLAALCAPSLGPQRRAEIIERLAAHTFADPEHEVIFRVLAKIPPAAAKHIRETLGARLTRLGFPDIDAEPIFELALLSQREISALLRQLGH